MHKVLVNRLGGLSLRRKSVVRFTDRPERSLLLMKCMTYFRFLTKIIYIYIYNLVSWGAVGCHKVPWGDKMQPTKVW